MSKNAPSRWTILALLFAIRATMAFQFQSVAAVAPLLKSELNVDIANVGFLIGMYFAPGVALAFLGGKIGQKFGDKPTALAGLTLMLLGGLLMAVSSDWNAQIAGRLIAGGGGVVLNVQMTKMVTDWFAGREIATAMAVFVNSWPAGIAVSLLTLPLVGTAYGVAAVYLSVTILIFVGLVVLAIFYRPPIARTAPLNSFASLDTNTIIAVGAAGLIWGIYNVGFAMIFSFGPIMLVERGWTITSAGSAISLVLWTCVVSIPIGGVVADRIKKPLAIMTLGWSATAIFLLSFSHGSDVVVSLVAIGLFVGIPAGSIMSLPGQALRPETRATGMGIFYTAYYVPMMVGPAVGGWFAKYAGEASTAIDFGAANFLVCVPILLCFLHMRRRPVAADS